jgi:hypothetical protein
MTTVTEIKAAIESLSPREYCELMAMLHPTVDDDWDRQMKADAASGRLEPRRERSVQGNNDHKQTRPGVIRTHDQGIMSADDGAT